MYFVIRVETALGEPHLSKQQVCIVYMASTYNAQKPDTKEFNPPIYRNLKNRTSPPTPKRRCLLMAGPDETLSTQSASLLRVPSQDKNFSQNVEYPPVYFDYFLTQGESIVHTRCMCEYVPDLFYTHIRTTGENLVGRGEDCDVTLSNGSLSRKHAQILVEKGWLNDY